MKLTSRTISRTLTLITCLFISSTVLAHHHTRLICEACRDPNVHPADFGNAAFNIARAPDSGLTFDEIGRMEVFNLIGQRAYITLEFEMLTLDFGFEIPTFVIPTGNIVVVVTGPNGRVTTYLIDLDVPFALTVGTGVGPGYNPAGGTGGGSNGGGDNEYDGDYGGDVGDYWDGFENGYGGLIGDVCRPDFSDPGNTIIICRVVP